MITFTFSPPISIQNFSMCRLSAFFGLPICAADLVTRPSRSIITQSFDARERLTADPLHPGYLNGDGFGLGWYSSNPNDVIPCVYRQARPAWNDPNLSSIAEKVYTPVLFAHVRAASQGLGVSEATCHPFRYGRFLWMHNGNLGNFGKVRRKLLGGLSEKAFDFAVEHGGSDSAFCFAVFLSLVDDPRSRASPDKLRFWMMETLRILEGALRDVEADQTSLLNFVVSDGDSMAASRYVISLKNPNADAASLYYSSGNSYESDGDAPGNYAMMHTDRRPSMIIVSSEPLTERRADWVEVPRNSCVVVTKSMHILVSSLEKKCDSLVSRVLKNLDGQTLERRTAIKRSPSGKDGTLDGNVVGSTVRSTIRLPDRICLCSIVMGPFLISGTEDGSIHVWNIENDVLSEVLRAGHRPVLAMLADEESDILICATSASIVIVFKMDENKKFKVLYVMCCDGTGDILSLTRIGNKVYAGFSDTRVRCIIDDVYATNMYSRHEKTSSAASFSEQASFGEMSMVHPEYEFPKTTTFATHYGHVFALVTCLNGRLLCTGSGDGLLRIWDMEKEQCVQKRDDHTGAILVLAAYEIEQGTMLLSGSRDRSVKVWVWDGDNGFICKRTLRKHKDEVIFLAVLDDKIVSGSADGAVCVWCATTLALICQYRDNGLKAGSVSTKHKLLFTASSDGRIRVRDFLSKRRDLDHKKVPIEMRSYQAAKSFRPDMKNLEGKHPTKQLDGGLASAKNCCEIGVDDPWHRSKNAMKSKFVGPDGYEDFIVTEVQEDLDEAETLVPGVTNELILAPPMSPLVAANRNQLISSLLDEKKPGAFAENGFQLEDRDKGVSGDVRGTSEMHTKDSTSEALERRLMQDVLAKFVSFPTVSSREEHREDCWQGARYISNFLEAFGATVKFVVAQEENCDTYGGNPIVLARFASVNPNANTLTFYGHYDVMPVDTAEWNSDPWTLTSVDGYFYGRGSTDNKGPIVAMIFAIKRLLDCNPDGLSSNFVFVLQGEGETSNAGFKECITSNLHWFENTSTIITSNSYWLGEKKPCLTYGFRGVIELRVSVSGGIKNLHTGVDGGALFEPMNDLITILSTLVDASGVVCIPGFYDDVRPLDDAEKELLNGVDFDVDEYRTATGVDCFTAERTAEVLEARWRKPSVSIASIETSNVSGFSSILPNRVSAKISIRFVPDQDPSKIQKAITDHLGFEIRKRRSPNKLTVECLNRGDWWLGDLGCPQIQIAAEAIREVWGVDPEYVCEGGSMPLFSYLAKTLEAPLVQVPMGQSSDGAHLPNERIRGLNLFRGKEVLQRIVQGFMQSGL